MDIQVIVPGFSLAIQLLSLFFAIRLVRHSQNRIIGIVFVLAIFLMSFRRFISLSRFVSHEAIPVDMLAETVALSISMLILFGVVLISRSLKSAEENRRVATFNDTLYRTLFNQSPDGVLLMNMVGEIVEFNDAVNRQLGYTRDEFKRLRIADIDPVESPEEIKESFERVLREGKDQFEVKHTTKHGEVRDVLVIVHRLELSGEIFFQTIWRDITEQKRWEKILIEDITERRKVEKALRESEDKFRSIFEEATDGIMIGDMETMRHIEANKSICKMLGYSREELVGMSVDAIHPEKDLYKVKEIFQKQGRGEFSLAPGVPMLRKDGSVFYADINSTCVTLGGRPCLVGIFRDITERRQTEEKLQKSEEFVGKILDTVDEGFIVVDREYRILTVNSAYCAQVGESAGKIVGRHCYAVSHKIDRPCHEHGEECPVRQVFATGQPHTALHRHNDALGNMMYVETKGYPIKDQTDTVTSVIETITNITERHLLEEERLKSQKLESIGTLAGGIAHDFNNLLQGVFGFISLAKLSHDRKEESLAMLEQAEEALHLSVNLTHQLLTFSKGGKPTKKLIRVTPVVENAVKFALSGSNTNYELDAATELWPVEADQGQIAQVIQNIVLNANQAMADGGTVHVDLANVEIGKETVVGLHAEGRFIRITIKDSGIGIDERNLARIFDPYFTTKLKGSGLGLATSYSIIKNHGGVIEVESEVNRGATFTIYIPAAQGVEIENRTVASSAVERNGGRILLMDDEVMIRNVAKEMFATLGQEVVFAEDGRKAIDLVREAKQDGLPFQMVILDLTVKGGMGGEEAIGKIREIDPEVKVVVSSGYAESPVVANYRDYGFAAVLNKPYRLEALNNCLNCLFR